MGNVVPKVGNGWISQKQVFPKSGTAKFNKNGCSRLWEQLKTKKMSVPDLGNEDF